MAQLVMDDIAIRLVDLNDTYDRTFKKIAKYNRFGILPDELLKESLEIKDHLANLATVAINWRDMAQVDGLFFDEEKKLSERVERIIKITSRMPYAEVISELTTAFNEMYSQLQANEEMLIKVGFKPLGDDNDVPG